jgi:hypothetical protein
MLVLELGARPERRRDSIAVRAEPGAEEAREKLKS